MELIARHSVTAERHDPFREGKPLISAKVEAVITLPDGLSDDALSRIQAVLNRELERFAQIAAVDVRDQAVAIDEAAHLATVPANRPVTIVAAGPRDLKDPNAVQHFWRGDGGELIPVSGPKADPKAKRLFDQYASDAKAHPRGIPHVDQARKIAATADAEDGGQK